MGEVAAIDDRYHGDALNIAARIQSIVRPDGMSVSARVYQALDEPALRFRSIGPQRMKGIPEQVEVHEFVDLPTDGPSPTAKGSLSFEAPTVAVLPIYTEMLDDQVRAGAELIRMESIHVLARVANPMANQCKPDRAPGRSYPGSARLLALDGCDRN